ncbi:hypothetical protein METBIDRAFT_41588, partial [Metschnikowia bicuspidata var. bicuspidata NRRL YB-4993]
IAMNSLDQVVNLKVRITNLLDESISGTIHAFSLKQRVLALKLTPTQAGKSTPSLQPVNDLYKIMNTSFIKSITVLPPFPKKHQRSLDQPAHVPKLNVAKLEEALNQMLSKANQTMPKHSPQPSPVPTGIKKSESPASKVYAKLLVKLGKENVQWQGNDSILLFKEVAVSKPYALSRISNSKRTQSSKYLEKAKTALREIWLADDNSTKGG